MESAIKTFANEAFGEVRIVIVDGEHFFVANDVCSALGYVKPNNAIQTHVPEKYRKVLKYKDYHTIFPELWNKVKDFQNKVVVSENGVSSLIVNSQNVALEKKIRIISTFQSNGFCKSVVLKSRPEIEFGEKLEKVLSPMHIKMIKQYPIGNYYIDFYLPEFNLAIEYDENDHCNYNLTQEQIRGKFIMDNLGCNILRLSDKTNNDSNIGKVLAKIFNR